MTPSEIQAKLDILKSEFIGPQGHVSVHVHNGQASAYAWHNGSARDNPAAHSQLCSAGARRGRGTMRCRAGPCGMTITHTFTVPRWVIDALLLAPGIRRFTSRIRRRLAHSRRWL